MSKYLLYKLNKNCAEMAIGSQNIPVSLGNPFFGAPCTSIYNYTCTVYKHKALYKGHSDGI